MKKVRAALGRSEFPEREREPYSLIRTARISKYQARLHLGPNHGLLGLLLISAAWPVSWLHAGPLAQYSFFPLWLGYILLVDAIVLRRTGTSLLTRNAAAFWGMFLVSAPLWWAFEGINHFTQNWRYLGVEHYSTLRYAVLASWQFSIVVPAVFETAELVGTWDFLRRVRSGPALVLPNGYVVAAIVAGLACTAALVLWPRYVFPVAWLSLALILDPINYLQGRPSILEVLRRGDWRIVVALAAASLICGWFWEMWNYWALPKWEYSIPAVDFARVFEMPLLGYGGYLPFGLEVYAGYHFLIGVLGFASRRQIPVVGLDQAGKMWGVQRGCAPLSVV